MLMTTEKDLLLHPRSVERNKFEDDCSQIEVIGAGEARKDSFGDPTLGFILWLGALQLRGMLEGTVT